VRIYLAAQFCRHDEMREVRDKLRDLGHDVQSRWIDLHGEENLTQPTVALLNTSPLDFVKYAVMDTEQVGNADAVISFSSGDGSSSTGGRHVELGMALALGKRVILVGPRENVFHTLPIIEWYPDTESLLTAL
jgi:nucleoside 2-deoxyribosyltransferase